MANMHIQTAAKNIRQAINDLMSNLVKEKAARDTKLNEIKSRISDIRKQEGSLTALTASIQTDQERSINLNSLQNLQREISDLDKLTMKVNDDFNQLQKDVDRQKMEFEAIAVKLEGIN